MSKLRVGVLFGGRSVEHEVSIASATSILSALDPARYDIRLIAIDHDGRWHLGTTALPPEATVRGDEVLLPAAPGGGLLLPSLAGGAGGTRALASAGAPRAIDAGEAGRQLDVIFPIVHGHGGEDGALQGLLELADVPYVGSGVLSSAVQMDKDVAKRLLRAAGLPVVPWATFRAADLEPARRAESARRAVEELGLPVFVKPANSGSSVGISKATSVETLAAALGEAVRYDVKVIVERAIDGREIEVAVLGNRQPEASLPGEIRTRHEFYDYEAKYVDEDTELLVPAPLSEAQTEQVRALALDAFRTLEAEGLARVDFFLERGSDTFWLNELNSLPGFTEASMFPRLWQASGLPYPALLDRLIELALERHREHARLETTYRTR